MKTRARRPALFLRWLALATPLALVVASCTCGYESDSFPPQGYAYEEGVYFDYQPPGSAPGENDPWITVVYKITATGNSGTFSIISLKLDLRLDGKPIPLTQLLFSTSQAFGTVSNFERLPALVSNRLLATNGGFSVRCRYKQAYVEGQSIEIDLNEVLAINTNRILTNSLTVKPYKKCI